MPAVSKLPQGIKPYKFHGIYLEEGSSDEWLGDCPWCHKEGKFSVNQVTGQWRCFSCNQGDDNGKVTRGGNVLSFLRRLWEVSYKQDTSYRELATHRGLVDPTTLPAWEVAKSVINGDWLVPGYNAKGEIIQLYRYVSSREIERWTLLATPEYIKDSATGDDKIFHGLHGMSLWRENVKEVYLCEGIWDGAAFWETMKTTKAGDDGFVFTSNEQLSLLKDAAVLATPSCNVFAESWLPLFAGKTVYLLFDNDHPRNRAGLDIPAAGYEGMKRVSHMLAKAETPPEAIHFLRWGENGFDPELPSGFDVRDHLTSDPKPSYRSTYLLPSLLDKVVPIPEEWLEGRTLAAKTSGGTEVQLLACHDWKTLRTSWRKALKWTDGLDRALAVMLAAVTSTKSAGDQLWVKIVGPAACGKSTLCEALSTNQKYVKALSTIRGFHSGYKSDKDGEEDHSLIVQIKDKTLVTKDGDTLLQSPNLPQILAEARDVYDRTSRTHYRHGMGHDYVNISCSWVLCGTNSLRSLDSSELGERFLDCVIMEGIDDALEDEILLRKVYQAKRDLAIEVNGQMDSQQNQELTKAMQLTGGYVGYLRQNATRLVEQVQMSDETALYLAKLGKFVAHMRARPSKTQDESAEREMATRLASQLTRLGSCLAVVLNRSEIDQDVIRWVRQVALDTSRGHTLKIATALFPRGQSGAEMKSVGAWVNLSDEKVKTFLTFLRNIGVAERFEFKVGPGMNGRPRWRLTERFARIYREVMGDDQSTAGGIF